MLAPSDTQKQPLWIRVLAFFPLILFWVADGNAISHLIVKFFSEGKLDENAGIRLVEHARKMLPDLPIILQSFKKSNETIAHKLKVAFLDKNLESLLYEIKNFLSNYLGFGNFVFRDEVGNPIAIATAMEEF